MGILGSIMGRREPEVAYRTVDGGHPAPYPDMTDEQLYNYEMTFDVPRRTFDKPPHSIKPKEEEPTIRRELKTEIRAEPRMEPRARQTETAFDAPRYTARPTQGSDNMREPASVFTQAATPAAARTLDLSKPVRLTTTKQSVEIITTRARHPVYKVHGYIGDDDVVTVFTIDGRLSENGFPYLENIPTKQQLHVNIYPNPDNHSRDRYLLTQHASRDEADAEARPGRLACVPVQFNA
ncbi:hypothetical protein [Noviherbaspirillum saxi]|uniref:Uncharacterized protein n=1 Tax=Noviherbaspirillum saxi TaxID=2320863 RepID=A0A3A3G5E2_9BURK|nr:hypothetical protein [Noviherbaspirillum saxi]RJF97345.1 hypothetical protein D3871_01455 [Noviherbaspirillum saxi]